MITNFNNISVANADFEQKVKQLKQSLKSRMNGKTTEQMQNGQIDYALNYGVSLAHVRELADTLDYTPTECSLLWQLNIREAMLIAAMKMPSEKTTTDEMLRWTALIRTPDMVEQGAFFLFWRILDIDNFAMAIMATNQSYRQSIAMFSVARAMQKGREVKNETINELLQAVSSIEQFTPSEARATSILLRVLINKDDYSMKVKSVLQQLKSSADDLAKQIAFEVESSVF